MKDRIIYLLEFIEKKLIDDESNKSEEIELGRLNNFEKSGL